MCANAPPGLPLLASQETYVQRVSVSICRCSIYLLLPSCVFLLHAPLYRTVSSKHLACDRLAFPCSFQIPGKLYCASSSLSGKLLTLYHTPRGGVKIQLLEHKRPENAHCLASSGLQTTGERKEFPVVHQDMTRVLSHSMSPPRHPPRGFPLRIMILSGWLFSG